MIKFLLDFEVEGIKRIGEGQTLGRICMHA